jgi:3',5'-cyclic AMP phosphodiesterase CpdA
MEHKLNGRFVLLISTVILLSSCLKREDIAETANQRFIQSMDWNNSHSYREINVPDDDYIILSMGDSHVGGTKNLDSFFSIAKTKKAAAIVLAGDLTTGQKNDYDEFEKHLPSQDLFPSFSVAGNHDLFSNGWNEYYSRFGSSSYYFTVKTPDAKDLYICLETGGGTLGTRQLEWLTNLLNTSRNDYRYCFVITHNNILRPRHTDSTNTLIEETEALMQIFAQYEVDMVITGHDHRQDASVFGNTTYIIMDALKDDDSNAGYFSLDINDGKINYRFEKF